MMVQENSIEQLSLVSLVDGMNEHMGKSLALGALLTKENMFSIDQELVEHYFLQIKDELWAIKLIWKGLYTWIESQADC